MKKRVLTIFFAIVFIVSSYMVLRGMIENNINQRLMKYMQELYYSDNDNDDGDDNTDKTQIMKKYINLLKMNQDIVGWIKVDNTSIDYPVVKTDNNDYYINYNLNFEKNKAGSIFMDYRNTGDGTDLHTILYGHNMRNGTMFRGLHNYKKEDFFKENRLIRFDTLYEEIEWEIFSVYSTDVNESNPNSFYYIITNFKTINEYGDFLNLIKGKSMYKSGVKLTQEDKILTLSTCTNEFSDGRLVVHAKRILADNE